ncbi:Teneurin-2 [Streptomyces glaucescens]|uniref:NHL domain-containing protein n=1 Tax=Streptomyces glaucescens TaxID=1907 RepID=UPI00344F19AF
MMMSKTQTAATESDDLAPDITTVAGTGDVGAQGDDGPAVAAQLDRPYGLAMDSTGTLYFSDYNNHRVRRVTTDGRIRTVAGTGTAGFGGDQGPAHSAQLDGPREVAVDRAGNLYIADSENHRIRKVTADGQIRTVAGTGTAGFSGDDGPAVAAELNCPYGVAVGSTGNLYIADTDNHRVRQVTPDGRIRTVAGTGTPGFSATAGLPPRRS